MLSRHDALEKFNSFNPALYAKTRNFLNGQISRLSAHIKYGIITNKDLYQCIRDKYNHGEIFGEAMPTRILINYGQI